MITKFNKEIKTILKHGRKELKETGNIITKAYIFGDDETIMTPVICSNDIKEKRLAIDRVRTISETSKAKCVVLIGDAYISHNGIHPILDPDRKEVINIVGEDENGKFNVTQEYTRELNNKIRLGKIKSVRDKTMDGFLMEEPFGVCS